MGVSSGEFRIGGSIQPYILAGGFLRIGEGVDVLQADDSLAGAFRLDRSDIKRNRQAVVEQPYRFIFLE